MIVFVVVGMKTNADAMKLLVAFKGGYGLLWWIGIMGLGLIVPLGYTIKRNTCTPQACLVISALILAGGFFMRYAILFAGQM
jgi:formate-dependent nitrite reductase membrane component NrfD